MIHRFCQEPIRTRTGADQGRGGCSSGWERWERWEGSPVRRPEEIPIPEIKSDSYF